MVKKYPDFFTILFYFLSLVILLLIQIPLLTIYPDLYEIEEYYIKFNSISNFVWYFGLFIVYIIAFRVYLLKELRFFTSNLGESIKLIIIGLVIMFGAAIISGMILLGLVGDQTSSNQEAIELMFNGDLFDKYAIVISTVIFAPVVEELLFRKALFNIFGKKLNVVFTVMLSSFFFGLIHVLGDNPAQIIYYFALGLGLGTVYHLSKKNFYVVVSMHLIVNLLVTYFMFLEY